MTLYSDGTCLESHCVRLVMAEKGIQFDLHVIDPQNPPDTLQPLKPYTDGIIFADREVVLYEPQIVIEYLDERFPHPPLMPVDPVARANNRLCRYRIQRDLYGHTEILQQASNKKKSATARRKLRENLISLAPIFTQRNYFMSDDYSLMDCCLIPLLWRLPLFEIELPKQAKPVLNYANRLFSRESFQSCLSKTEREIQT